MSETVKNPNQRSAGFVWALVAIVVIAAVIIGYIVINNKKNKPDPTADGAYETVSMSMETSDTTITLKSDNAKADAPEVELYEDFSCIHCAHLAEVTDGQMREEIEAGNLIVDVHSLNFLDKGKEGWSTKALAAVISVAEAGDASLYWNYRSMLMEKQSEIGPKWSNNDLADAAEKMGAEKSVVKDIQDGKNIERAKTVATENADHLKDQTGSVSSPRILLDGKDVNADHPDQWVNTVVKK